MAPIIQKALAISALLALTVSAVPVPEPAVSKCYPGQLCDGQPPNGEPSVARRAAEAEADSLSPSDLWCDDVEGDDEECYGATLKAREPGSRKGAFDEPWVSTKARREAGSNRHSFDDPPWSSKVKREPGSRKGAFDEPWVSTKREAGSNRHSFDDPPWSSKTKREAGSRKGAFDEPWVST